MSTNELHLDLNLVRVWNVTRAADGKKIRVATIEQGPKRKSMCVGAR